MERDPSVSSQQRGAALLLVVLSTALVGYLSYRLAVHSTAYRNFVLSYLRGFSQQQAVREQLTPVQSASRMCAVQTVSTNSAAAHRWKVCTVGSPPLLTTPPHPLPSNRVDFRALLHNATPCRFERSQGSEMIFSEPKASATCIAPSILNEPLVTLDNIRIRDLSIALPPHSSNLILATPGTLLTEGALTLNSSSIIVAGGNLRIATLRTTSSERIAVTLLSAHGDIVVGQTVGAISVLSIGRQLLAVPPTPPAPVFILPPFLTQPSIAGIIPLSG
jgi:hypothetical protein